MLKSPARIQLFSAVELEILAKICASETSLHQLLRLNEHQLQSPQVDFPLTMVDPKME